MRRERSYQQRNRLIHLDEVNELVAMHGAEGNRNVSRLAQAKPLSIRELDSVAPDVPLPQVRAFEESGWIFVPRIDSAQIPPEAVQAKVFVRRGGQLALGTNNLTVRFLKEMSAPEADDILQPFGCRVVERLTFAPGLYRAVLADDSKGDILDVANALNDSELVDFAEPELIEATGHRS